MAHKLLFMIRGGKLITILMPDSQKWPTKRKECGMRGALSPLISLCTITNRFLKISFELKIYQVFLFCH